MPAVVNISNFKRDRCHQVGGANSLARRSEKRVVVASVLTTHQKLNDSALSIYTYDTKRPSQSRMNQ